MDLLKVVEREETLFCVDRLATPEEVATSKVEVKAPEVIMSDPLIQGMPMQASSPEAGPVYSS